MDPYPLDSKHFGFLDPDPQKYADPRGSRGQNINLKLQTKSSVFNLKSAKLKNKEIILFSEWVSFLKKEK